LVELTGAIEFGAHVVMKAIEHRKHVILMNAELDATVGPILKVYADRAGVILTGCDGDQPGVEINLYRFVKSIGLTPLVCGNIRVCKTDIAILPPRQGLQNNGVKHPHGNQLC
jgi:predicted homoserine dehydrogenase-like protein